MFDSLHGASSDYREAAIVYLQDTASDTSPLLQYIPLQPFFKILSIRHSMDFGIFYHTFCVEVVNISFPKLKGKNTTT